MTLPGSNYVFNDLFFKNQHQIFFENIISEIMKTLLKVSLTPDNFKKHGKKGSKI